MAASRNRHRKETYPDDRDHVSRVTDRNSCLGKNRYRDEYEAARVLRKTARKAEAAGRKPPVRWYYHSVCDGFHITSQPLSGVKKRVNAVAWDDGIADFSEQGGYELARGDVRMLLARYAGDAPERVIEVILTWAHGGGVVT